jgi:cysteine desulfurase
MKQPVYLDHAASTPVDARVAAKMNEVLTDPRSFGNSASDSHCFGEVASSLVEQARRQVAAAVRAKPSEVIFTSGATESNNLAIFGAAHYYRERGRHLITVRTEHKAVLDPYRELERRGWSVSYLVPDRAGRLDPLQVKSALRADTVLASVMHVNNEIGVIHDIAAIASICAQHGTRLHVDAAQSMGKCSLDFAASGADLMSLSAHKSYGPKGVGALLVSRSRQGVHPAPIQLTPLQSGGGQEAGLRAGTLATHQIAGMGLAFEIAAASLADDREHTAPLQQRLWRGLSALGGVLRNGDPQHSVPHVLNVSFEGVEGESLLAAVRGEIAVSTGSACTSATAEPSYVLRALGRDERLAEASLRFGLGRATGAAEIDAAIAVLTREVPRLRRMAGS